MRLLLAWIIVMLLGVYPGSAWDLSDLLKPKKKPVQTVRRKKKHAPAKTKSDKETPAPQIFVVDQEWMARYRALEAIWQYQIPEDDQIRFYENKYYVPPVVYRHYEDMARTPLRTADH